MTNEEIKAYECTYRETGCGSCKNQLNCPNNEIDGDMQNDEAIKILKDIIDYSDGGIFPKDIEAINLAIKVLEQTRWIPVSERLPDYDTQVIITVLDDSGDNPYRYTTVGWRFYDAWISDNELVFDKVLAWKPIPEKPYEGE